MKQELELEAEKYYRENVEGEPLTWETPIHCFIAGATSKYVKKQKLEFAIRQLRECKKGVFNTVENKVKELELQLEKI